MKIFAHVNVATVVKSAAARRFGLCELLQALASCCCSADWQVVGLVAPPSRLISSFCVLLLLFVVLFPPCVCLNVSKVCVELY